MSGYDTCEDSKGSARHNHRQFSDPLQDGSSEQPTGGLEQTRSQVQDISRCKSHIHRVLILHLHVRVLSGGISS